MLDVRTGYVFAFIAVFLATLAVGVTARAGYESAEYKILEKDGNFEIREYPDLMVASTECPADPQNNGDGFMRLFRYITGANESKQKIAMTTPVFMGKDEGDDKGHMEFVMPKEVATQGVPAPSGDNVDIRERQGGRFAVVRFSGRMNASLASKQEAKLREWLKSRGKHASDMAECAGYDPPYTPGPLRRNEVLIRLETSEGENSSNVKPEAQ